MPSGGRIGLVAVFLVCLAVAVGLGLWYALARGSVLFIVSFSIGIVFMAAAILVDDSERR